MAKIIAGRFDTTVDADAAVEALRREGFAREEIDSFYVAPPGQHGLYPLGGDADADAGAGQAGIGAVIGGVIGGLLGMLIGFLVARNYGAVVVLFGAGVGAYVGSFLGAMRKVHHPRPDEATSEH